MAAGSRVAILGNGGDQFFSVSPVYFADLVRTGRWARIPGEWLDRAGWYFNPRGFFRFGIQPMLPDFAIRLSGVIRPGRPLRHYLYHRIQPWIRADFARQHNLEERSLVLPPRRRGESYSAREHAWHFYNTFSERTIAIHAAMSLHEGVEVRLPIFDSRVIQIAAHRPRWECNGGGHNKHLLRRAARELLPESVWATRPKRTGQPRVYFLRATTGVLEEALSLFGNRWILADLGIVEPSVFAERAKIFLGGNHDDLDEANAMGYTAQVEHWLRAHLTGAAPARASADAGGEAYGESVTGRNRMKTG